MAIMRTVTTTPMERPPQRLNHSHFPRKSLLPKTTRLTPGTKQPHRLSVLQSSSLVCDAVLWLEKSDQVTDLALFIGVVVHSVIIGLTLAVTDEFDTLFVVIIFHQTYVSSTSKPAERCG